MMREGLKQFIDAEPDMEVCWAAASAPEAMSALERHRPDMLTVDITLPGRNGLELIKDVLALSPGLPILVISMHDETLYAQRVLKCGAKGYIMKDAPHDDLMAAIRRVAAGKVWLSGEMSEEILNAFSGGKPRRQDLRRLAEFGEADAFVLKDDELAVGKGLAGREDLGGGQGRVLEDPGRHAADDPLFHLERGAGRGQGRLGLTKRMPMRRQQVLDHRFARVGLEQIQKAELQAGARRRQRMHRRAARRQQQPLHIRPARGGRTPDLAAGTGSRGAEQPGLGERADPPDDHVGDRLKARRADLLREQRLAR